MNKGLIFNNSIAGLKTLLFLVLSFLYVNSFSSEIKKEGQIYMQKAASFSRIHQKDSVLFYLDKAHEILSKNKQDTLYPILCNRLSHVYRKLGKPKKSVEFSREAINYFHEKDSNRLAHFYLSLVSGYRALGELDSLSLILEKVIYLNKDGKDSILTVISAANMGYLKYERGDSTSKHEYVSYALSLALDNPRLYIHIPWIALVLGDNEATNHNLNSALKKYYLALEYIRSPNHEMSALLHHKIALCYESIKEIDSAFYHQKESSRFKELFLKQNRQEAILKLEKQFETRIKENQILKLENQKLESDIRTKNLRILLLALISLLIIILLVFIYFKNRSKTKQNLATQEIAFLKNKNKLLALESLIQGEENERKRIAQELHDSIGASLSCIQMILKKEENESVTSAKKMIEECIEETRNISRNLTPQVLKKLGLVEAINLLCLRAKEAKNIEVHKNFTILSSLNIDYAQKLHLYRILEECFANSIKHSEAENIYINATLVEGELSLSFEDDGNGINLKKKDTGMGLQNLKNRANALGGTIQIESEKDAGCLLILNINIG